MTSVVSIVAVTKEWGIGKNGVLPWQFYGKHLAQDMRIFTKLMTETNTYSSSGTKKVNAIIMGRLTWQSIPEQRRPLKGRVNIVISKGFDVASVNLNNDGSPLSQVYRADSFEDALNLVDSHPALVDIVEKVVVIGGSQLFEESILHNRFKSLYLTEVDEPFDCDIFLTSKTVDLINTWSPSIVHPDMQDDGISYRIKEYHI